MTEKEMRRLSRADLLEMLIEQSTELQTLREKLSAAEAALAKRELAIDTAGSIAEASLQLSGIFEAAQASCQQYTDNIRLLSERQEAVCAKREQESLEKAERLVSDAAKKSAELERETRLQCDEMQARAQAESQAYWDEVTTRLDAFYAEHVSLRELLSIGSAKREQEQP